MRAEGVFAFAGKELKKAEAAGDEILAVIAGVSINNAGPEEGTTGLQPGRYITAPTVSGQREVMLSAYHRAGVDTSIIK
jgi:acyl transferase domain-containing protein